HDLRLGSVHPRLATLLMNLPIRLLALPGAVTAPATPRTGLHLDGPGLGPFFAADATRSLRTLLLLLILSTFTAGQRPRHRSGGHVPEPIVPVIHARGVDRRRDGAAHGVLHEHDPAGRVDLEILVEYALSAAAQDPLPLLQGQRNLSLGAVLALRL